jgi:tetratricopeptide (TPR) repeat protein
LYRIENNFHEAETALLAASKAKPGDPDLRERLAYTQRRTGKWDESISNLQLAYELDPANVAARSSMIETLLRMREFDRAEPLIDTWMEKYPQALSIKAYKVWLLIRRDGDLAGARNLLDQIEPNAASPYYNAITFVPLLERDYPAALDIFDQPEFLRLTDLPVYRAAALLTKASVYHAMGDSNKANENARSAIEVFSEFFPVSDSDRNNAMRMSFLAYAYALSGELAKALEAIDQARAFMPESRDSYDGTDHSEARAWILALSGEHDEALSEIERLLSIPSGLNRWELYLDPGWDFMRDDERFNELIRPPNLEDTAL